MTAKATQKKNRLGHVARDVPQLASVIFALTEWTANVASRNDLELRLLEIETEEDEPAPGGGEDSLGPLRIVIQRVILYEPKHKQEQDPSDLIAGCANLINRILLSPACNSKLDSANKADNAARSSAMEKILGELLGRGRALAFQMKSSAGGETAPTPKQAADGISNCIMELLQRSSREKRAREMRLDSSLEGGANFGALTGSQAEEMVRRLDAEIHELEPKAESLDSTKDLSLSVGEVSRDDILTLLSKRDGMKKMAKLSGMVLELTLGANVQSHENELVEKVIGISFDNSIKSSLPEDTSETEKGGTLKLRRISISSKREELAQRMEKLKRELNELEIEDQDLAAEEKNVVSELGLLETISQGGIENFEKGMKCKVGHFGADNEVKGVMVKMGELERACTGSLSASDPASPVSTTSLFPQKLEQYLRHVCSHFQAEAQSIQFLCNRVSTAEAKVLEIESELQPCLELGMTTNVELMNRDLRAAKSHLQEDKLAIDSLKSNVQEMLSDLTCHVEDYCRSDPDALKPPHSQIIGEISRYLIRIESQVDLEGKEGSISLSKYSSEPAPLEYVSLVNGTEAKSVPEAIPVTKSNGGVPPPAPAPPTPVVMPKFSWAKKAADAPKKETKSFLDIQHEELLEKNGTAIAK